MQGERISDMEPVISVIMPLYNAERFLEETLISVSRQTFQNYELICVIDGSEDNTVNIVRKFQQKDSRIKLFYNGKHSGAAVARNRGIEEAVGKYLLFLDGDDIFDEELMELTFCKAEEQKADIVMFEYKHVASEHIHKKQVIFHSKEYRNRFCNRVLSVDNIKICEFLMWSSSPCNKLFRTEFISRHCLEFQNIRSSNDTYFVDMAFLMAERIIILDSPKVMVYARDHFTPSRISIDRNPMCTYDAMMKMKDELKRRGIFLTLYKVYSYNAFHCMLIGLKSTKNVDRKRTFLKFLIDKGLDDLLEISENISGVDQFLQEKKDCFMNLQSDEEWEQLDFVYEAFLEENFNEISTIFENCKARNLRIGIWGAGGNGTRLITFCNRYHLGIDMVLDIDKMKQGKICGGYQIQSPKNVSALDVVIVTPTGIYPSIIEMIRIYNKNAQVIDLSSFICFN